MEAPPRDIAEIQYLFIMVAGENGDAYKIGFLLMRNIPFQMQYSLSYLNMFDTFVV